MQTKTRTQYFYGCESIDEVKVRYKKLVKTTHPDAGGSHEEFVELKEQYDNILEKGLTVNWAEELLKTYTQPAAQETHLSPDELNKIKADNHFNRLRSVDKTFDIIDGILAQAKKEKLKPLWIFQEVAKLLELEVNHFKYTTYKTRTSPSIAHQLYKKYMGI